MDLHDLIFKRQQYLVSHVRLNLKEWDLRCLLQKILRQVLVNVPNVARLQILELLLKRDVLVGHYLREHAVVVEQVEHERVPDEVVLSEL